MLDLDQWSSVNDCGLGRLKEGEALQDLISFDFGLREFEKFSAAGGEDWRQAKESLPGGRVSRGWEENIAGSLHLI